MDTLRHIVAVVVVISLPPAIFYWVVIHPFAAFWRRVGGHWGIAAASVVLVGMMAGLFFVRGALLGPDLGTHLGTTVSGVVFLTVAIVMAVKRKRHLTFRILAGVPEVSSADPGKLLTEGPYSLIRHPRYVEVFVGTLGYALIANYVGGYVVTAACIPALLGLVVMEERELRDRFGQAYADYSARVPRFIPRRRGASSTGSS
jgi:protein-S-isoprenylcysteine O-methyltransferase Ste14